MLGRDGMASRKLRPTEMAEVVHVLASMCGAELVARGVAIGTPSGSMDEDSVLPA